MKEFKLLRNIVKSSEGSWRGPAGMEIPVTDEQLDEESEYGWEVCYAYNEGCCVMLQRDRP